MFRFFLGERVGIDKTWQDIDSRDIVFPFHFQDTPDLKSVADWQILFHLCRAFSVGVGVGGDRQHLAGSRDSCRRRC